MSRCLGQEREIVSIECSAPLQTAQPSEALGCLECGGGAFDRNSITAAFIEAVAAEVVKARAKWPGNRVQLAALTEEVGELAQALLQHDYEGGAAAKVWKEAVQVAAMAVRVATEGDSSFGYKPATALE